MKIYLVMKMANLSTGMYTPIKAFRKRQDAEVYVGRGYVEKEIRPSVINRYPLKIEEMELE